MTVPAVVWSSLMCPPVAVVAVASASASTTAVAATTTRWSAALRRHPHWYYGPPHRRVTASSSCAASGPPSSRACSCYGRLCGLPARRHDMISGVNTTLQRITAVVRSSFTPQAAAAFVPLNYALPAYPSSKYNTIQSILHITDQSSGVNTNVVFFFGGGGSIYCVDFFSNLWAFLKVKQKYSVLVLRNITLGGWPDTRITPRNCATGSAIGHRRNLHALSEPIFESA